MARKNHPVEKLAEDNVEQVNLGDLVEFPEVASALVRLPDGTVVTARTSYMVRQPGEHLIFTSDPDGATTARVVNVTIEGQDR